MRNNKNESFPEIKPRPIWVEFLVGFFSGMASTLFVSKGQVVASLAWLYGPSFLAWLVQYAELWHPPQLAFLNDFPPRMPGSPPIRAFWSKHR
jgi:hypothetical protein